MTTRVKDSLSSDSSVLAARVHALIAQWREEAELETVDRHPGWVAAESALRACADALEAALAAARQEPEQHVSGLCAFHRESIGHAVKLAVESCNACAALAAALAPHPARPETEE